MSQPNRKVKTLWFVLRLSTCFKKRSWRSIATFLNINRTVQYSLQIHLITSIFSANRVLSIVTLLIEENGSNSDKEILLCYLLPHAKPELLNLIQQRLITRKEKKNTSDDDIGKGEEGGGEGKDLFILTLLTSSQQYIENLD